MQTFHYPLDADPADELAHAAALMQRALDLLDQVGETRAAVYLQHALDTLSPQLPIGPTNQ